VGGKACCLSFFGGCGLSSAGEEAGSAGSVVLVSRDHGAEEHKNDAASSAKTRDSQAHSRDR